MARSTILAGLVCFSVFAASATAAIADTTLCTLTFGMRGYSKQFEQSTGRGTIVCDNGQKATVAVLGRGTGLHDGAGAFSSGTGTFSPVLDISALLGSYALPPAARAGGARPLGASGAMSNGQATLTFPIAGPSARVPQLFGRIGLLPHPLSY